MSAAVELTESYLARIKQYDATLNRFITVVEDQAMQQASEADKALRSWRGWPVNRRADRSQGYFLHPGYQNQLRFENAG